MHGHRLLPILLVAACCPTPKPAAAPAHPATAAATPAPAPVTEVGPVDLDHLTEGEHVHGFTAKALYLDDADHPMGARFVHDKTGFVFDYLRIESAPQGFIWVNSFPADDRGEPHTQEHLLLGKGDRGRRLGSVEAMDLATSSAFTEQWRTCYHFNTVAGNDVFWPVFENQLDALLNPDYTDEEIRREVRNFGVDKGPDGALRLEEKGTVYNEMVRAYEQPETNMWRAAGQLVYGPNHPLALDSGGYPPAIRTMTPADIRAFHDAAYTLPNMGMVGAFPSAMALSDVLDKTAAILDKEAGRTGKVMSEADLPRPAPPDALGTIKVVDYPYSDDAHPGPMMLAWPATRALDDKQLTMLGLFFDALAGDESTPLYHQLIDSKTRTIDTGATGLWTNVSSDEGNPVFLGLDGVRADKLDPATVAQVRGIVLAELDHIAKLPAGDPELVAFDRAVQARIVDLRRRLDKFLDTPPGFGFRGTGSDWISALHQLDKQPGFKKELTKRAELAELEAMLGGTTNPWTSLIHQWGLDQTPYGVASKPSVARRQQLDAGRKQRIDAELARLQQQYGTKDAAATLARYAQDYDAKTKEIAATEKAVQLPPLVASPPMTLDDGLHYTTGDVAGVPSLAATFDTMTSARVQLAFRVGPGAKPDDDVVLAALPALMSDTGVIEDGKPISSGEMKDRLRREILELSVYYTSDLRTNRVELVVAGAGNGADETKRALAWMKRVMFAPDWRLENLPRLRDVVAQRLEAAQRRMLGSEETWVEDPAHAWWQQGSEIYLRTSSFLTKAHDLHRLRWMLEDPQDPKVKAEVVKFLATLEQARALPRAQLAELAEAIAHGTPPKDHRLARWTAAEARLSAKAQPIARDAGKDLAELLGDLPDGSLGADWAYLCHEMSYDLQRGAAEALAELNAARTRLLAAANARAVIVGSSATQQAIAGQLAELVGALPRGTAIAAQPVSGARPFDARLREHDRDAKDPVFVGLVDPATSSGVFLNLAHATSYEDTAEPAILDYLASNLYTGHGAHTIYMKTWAAGLAYSNGLHPQPYNGMLEYYAERCPLLPQTIQFVIGQLEAATPDESIARYAIASAFNSRIADPYEERAAAMAADLADGQTPDVMRAFRSRVLEAGKRPDLAKTLFERMPAVYGRVLPGMGPITGLDAHGTYFVIGPEKQLAAYDGYLKATVGKATPHAQRLATLHRIYPRDFWIPASFKAAR